MLGMLGLAATIAAIILGYLSTRRFVRTRLRFVDAIQRRRAAWFAGAGAALIALPVAWLLPLVGTGTALLFGAAVGTGVAHGARDVRKGTAGLLEGM
jgi:hypothetical protein